MIDTYKHHSASSLNLFAASPAMWVLEKVLGIKQTVGVPAHRGVAVEDGVSHGLKTGAPEKDCIQIAHAKYDLLTAMSPDDRRQKYRDNIPDMVVQALDELRPYGVPSSTQGSIAYSPPGLKLPIIGYYDFLWEDKGLIVDLKTTERMPSEIKIPHARQVALYSGDNHDGRLTYVTPKKCQTYQLENIREHRQALLNIAVKVENLLALSDDPKFFVSITAPDLDSFYWSAPATRQLAYLHWGI